MKKKIIILIIVISLIVSIAYAYSNIQISNPQLITGMQTTESCPDLKSEIQSCLAKDWEVEKITENNCVVKIKCTPPLRIAVIKTIKGIFVQITDYKANTDSSKQEIVNFKIRIGTDIIKNFEAVETGVNTGVFGSEIIFRKRTNELTGFFYWVTGLFINPPITYLDVFEGENLVIMYKNMEKTYKMYNTEEEMLSICPTDYISEKQACINEGNTPVIEIDDEGCNYLVRCDPGCPDIQQEINDCANQGGKPLIKRNGMCFLFEKCEMQLQEVQPVLNVPAITINGLTPPTQVYCDFPTPESENLELIKINNLRYANGVISFDLENNNYAKQVIISTRIYNQNNELLTIKNELATVQNRETKTITLPTIEFTSLNALIEIITQNGKLAGKYQGIVEIQ